jgi:hypothetical protein
MPETIPKQVHPLLKEAIKQLPEGWAVVKKRDHYFLHHNGRRVICIGNNSSKINDYQAKKSLHSLQRYMENVDGPDNSGLRNLL